MATYRMIIRTTTVQDGRETNTREIVPHIPADQLDSRRETARLGAPFGATRTIRVVDQY